MRPGLHNVDLKIARAKEHLDAVQTEITALYKSDTHTSRMEGDPETGHYKTHFCVPPVPQRLGIVAADFFTCLRGSLDYLAWQLALLTHSNPGSLTAFPIIGQKAKGSMTRFKNATKCLPAGAVSIIESLQSYHRGDSYMDDWLWKLNNFSNISKHREIPAFGTMRTVGVDVPEGTTVETLDNGDVVINYPAGKFTDVKLHPKSPLKVIFGDSLGGIHASMDDLYIMHEVVSNDVLPRFTGFFSQSERT